MVWPNAQHLDVGDEKHRLIYGRTTTNTATTDVFARSLDDWLTCVHCHTSHRCRLEWTMHSSVCLLCANDRTARTGVTSALILQTTLCRFVGAQVGSCGLPGCEIKLWTFNVPTVNVTAFAVRSDVVTTGCKV